MQSQSSTPECHLDFETYSEVDLTKVGAYRYAQDPTTEVLVCSYQIGGHLHRWVPHRDGNAMPLPLARAVQAGALLVAHNAEFEYAIWHGVLVARMGWPALPLRRWRCTAAMAATVDYPRALEGAAPAAGLAHTKDPRGERLLKLFTRPRKPTKHDTRTRIRPEDDPAQFEELCEYCDQDVRTERELYHTLPRMHPWEWRNFWLNMHINGNGIPLDMGLLAGATKVVSAIEHKNNQRTLELTGGLKATQRDKMLAWFEDNGLVLENMQADTVRASIKNLNLPPDTIELLNLRIEASRASTKKLISMRKMVATDGRVRGTHMFYGAHSGRDSARLLQTQNFIRGLSEPEEIEPIRHALRTGDWRWFYLLYGPNAMETVSLIMRSFIAATKGKILYIVDYSQIEARVLDWLANNVDGLGRWRSGIDPYKLMASLIFDIPIDAVTPEQRRIGKNAVLGCGYSMSPPAFLQYCHNNGAFDVDEELADLAVGTYREVNKPNVDYWRDVENAAKAAVADGKTYRVRQASFAMHDHWLTILLPSGRRLWYPHARLNAQRTRYGKLRQSLEYRSPHGVRSTYGGKIVENIDQAISRDMLMMGCYAGMRLSYTPVMKVHDEVVFEDEPGRDIKALAAAMCELPPWLQGCPIEAKGFVSEYYRKD